MLFHDRFRYSSHDKVPPKLCRHGQVATNSPVRSRSLPDESDEAR